MYIFKIQIFKQSIKEETHSHRDTLTTTLKWTFYASQKLQLEKTCQELKHWWRAPLYIYWSCVKSRQSSMTIFHLCFQEYNVTEIFFSCFINSPDPEFSLLCLPHYQPGGRGSTRHFLVQISESSPSQISFVWVKSEQKRRQKMRLFAPCSVLQQKRVVVP